MPYELTDTPFGWAMYDREAGIAFSVYPTSVEVCLHGLVLHPFDWERLGETWWEGSYCDMRSRPVEPL